MRAKRDRRHLELRVAGGEPAERDPKGVGCMKTPLVTKKEGMKQEESIFGPLFLELFWSVGHPPHPSPDLFHEAEALSPSSPPLSHPPIIFGFRGCLFLTGAALTLGQ